MADTLGPFPVSPSSWGASRNLSGLSSPLLRTSEAVTNSDSNLKRHAACDECRTRKLKCSGQQNGCDRCIKQGIVCHYSEQKQMGRPRKRQKIDAEPVQQRTPPTPTVGTEQMFDYPPTDNYLILENGAENGRLDLPIDPTLSAIEQENIEFQNLCNSPFAQTIRDQAGADTLGRQVAHYESLNGNHTNGAEMLDTSQPQYPLDIAQWPDYSTFETLPLPLQPETDDSYLTISQYPLSTEQSGGTSYDPDADRASLSALPASPSCSCLANLYLTLSTLASVSAFPTSTQTVETLLAAQRTAHRVIYCPVCPRKFQTGSQNLMLGCTLLNVLADNWHKVKGLTSEELERGFSSKGGRTAANGGFLSTRQGDAWRSFQKQLIQAYCFGDVPIPTPPSDWPLATMTFESQEQEQLSGNEPRTLVGEKKVPAEYALFSVIKALERRQRQWHNFDESTDEFPDRCNEGYSYHHHHFLQSEPNKSKSTNITSRSTESTSDTEKNATDKPNYCKVHGKSHDHARAQNNSNAEGEINEATNKPGNGTETEAQAQASSFGPENAVCLMIVKYSLNVVRSLSTECLG